MKAFFGKFLFWKQSSDEPEHFKLKFPGLYDCASDVSEKEQKMYLRLIKIEYLLLLITSVTALLKFETQYLIATLILVLGLLACQLFRSFKKPEQTWYRARALAESVKTITWRYVMGSAPFNDISIKNDEKISTREFLQRLEEIKKVNDFDSIAPIAKPDFVHADAITDSMKVVRAYSLVEKKAFYREQRIQDQRIWYATKAESNKKANRNWLICIVVLIVVYLIAMLLVASNHIQKDDWFSNVEPILIVITALIGWVQIKKHGELASSYILTAHEIQKLIQELSLLGDNPEEFEQFVDSAEQAFSREHTQWVARKKF